MAISGMTASPALTWTTGPRTYGDDLDPLDVLVLCSEPILPMTIVRSYPIGMIRMLDFGRNDEKIIAIPFSEPTCNGYRNITELHAMYLRR